jgi:hypothetical protein
MKSRKLTLAAVVAFVFAGSTAVFAHPPLQPCQECRIGYNVCLYEGHGQNDAACKVAYEECKAEAGGCPLD